MLIVYLLSGPKIVSDSKAVPSYSTLNVSDWTANFPTGGFHIDLGQKQLDFWMAEDCPNGLSAVAKHGAIGK